MTKLAIVIGIDEYRNVPLNCCVKDAETICEILDIEEYGFDVKCLLNDEATKTGIKRLLRESLDSKPDLFLFYFAGHGIKTQEGCYLVTYDYKPFDEGISFNFMRRTIENISYKDMNFLMILDCCNSGGAEIAKLSDNAKDLEICDLQNDLAPVGKGRAVLAACPSGKKASEDLNTGHGEFTYHLSEGLLGEAADETGEITIAGLYDYISDKMKNNIQQSPVFKSEIVGKFCIGNNFSPSVKITFTKDKVHKYEMLSKKYMQDYQDVISKYDGLDIEVWKREGYKRCCQALNPISDWFKKRWTQDLPLTKNNIFQKNYYACRNRVGRLSSIDIGTETMNGKVVEIIGQGTFGTVYKLITDETNNNITALKIYHQQDINNLSKISRFERGYNAMKQLNHPHIVKVKSYLNCPVGFIMEYIDGPNFRDFAGTLDIIDTLKLLRVIADTLRHAHKRGVVHRDVKPENIILSHSQNEDIWMPFLTDFDLAWFSTATQLTKDAFGTLYYGAPEQLAKPTSAAAHEPTVDIFSFGQLCYYAFCTSDPVPLQMADNERAISERLNLWQVEKAATKMRDLYIKCCQLKPRNRPKNFDYISDSLTDIIQLVTNNDDGVIIDKERFLKELIFSIIGLLPDKYISKNTFENVVSNCRITITFKNETVDYVDLSIEINAISEPIVEGADNRAQARDIINKKIDKAIGNESNVTRHRGNQMPFQTYIIITNIRLDLDSVKYVRRILTATLDCI